MGPSATPCKEMARIGWVAYDRGSIALQPLEYLDTLGNRCACRAHPIPRAFWAYDGESRDTTNYQLLCQQPDRNDFLNAQQPVGG